ncbi:histidine kinase receptor of two-component system [Lithospermum erythrorhizon]|uniref:histidine kinase n=1 Tax=Lithospermum erythrorhizon TaxID=34254 RepID=A0AAV3QI05_LITER
MSLLDVVGFGLKVGHLVLMIGWWLVTAVSLNWLCQGAVMTKKPSSLESGVHIWLNQWHKIKCVSSSLHFGSIKVKISLWKKLLLTWVVFWILVSLFAFWYLSSQAVENRREKLASMCDERARMLQDQFYVSMNHIQSMSILISTFHHGMTPSAIDQMTFARYTERTAFERPLTIGVAYAVRVLHADREQFEKQQGWSIKSMDTLEQIEVRKGQYNPEAVDPSPIQEEYAPVIFAQDTVAHVISLDMLSGKEDRENVLCSRASGKGVLTAPFRLLKSNRLGVILTFAVYKRVLPSNATSTERIEAVNGYLGGIFDIESLVEKLLQQLASKQTILVNVYDTTNVSNPISMYGSNVTDDRLLHVSALNFGDPHRRHEMNCRFKQKPPWPWLGIWTSFGILVIALLVGEMFHATIKRIEKVEDDYHEMMELKRRAEAADVAKSQFLATVSHEIRTPMNGVLGMLYMLMDTDMDETQQDYVRTAQASGKALVSLINEVLDQAKIESGKLELEAVRFNLRAILDDVLSLFSGKSQEKGIELAVYVSDRVPEMLIGDPGRFRQIITNLMGNSIKFTERGHILVTVHILEEVKDLIELETGSSPANTLSAFPVADSPQSWAGFKAFSDDSFPSSCPSDNINLLVSVEDTGVGIPSEAQSRMFTPFMQVRPSIARVHGGTGIGLSISKCLVHLMKGEIGFVSVPNIGSTFSFTAVFTNADSNSTEKWNQQIVNQSKSPEFCCTRALVVDSRPVRAKITKYHMQRLGIHVELALNLDSGLTIISSRRKPVKAVLIDQEEWNKDLASSVRFAKILQKSSQSGAPKLFLLTNSVSTTKSSILDCGASMPVVITKPLRESMLAASLQRAMGIGSNGNNKDGYLSSLPLRSLLLGRKILVVDDNKVNLKVATGALRKYGADVVCAESGENAISLLDPPHQFDACFMDIQMPEMDGFEATRRIREMESSINNRIKHGEISGEAYGNVSDWHIPVLAMTADVIQATSEQCLKCGMDGYVSKPFEAEQLYREVSRFFPK